MCVIGIMAFASSAYAQVLQEVVYLKNGSVIKGTIVEQIPNESIKIRTNDGSIFAYQMSDVEKIAKEEVYPSRSKTSYNKANTPMKVSYRGFANLGFAVGAKRGNGGSHIEVSTSHGVQIIPQLFVGAGIGFSYYYDLGCVMPIFANIRTDILKSRISPFVDFRIGYAPCLSSVGGLYLSPTIGCRFNKFSVGVSYVMQKYDVLSWYRANAGGISLRFSFEF